MSNKRKQPSPSSVTFHSDFQEPTEADRLEALGAFPSTEPRPGALWKNVDSSSLALDDIDNPLLYRNSDSVPIPQPVDELDWLAQVPEEGQSLSDYTTFLTSRSGRLRPIANAEGNTILLLPIISETDSKITGAPPQLDALVEIARAFFQRPVQVLSPAVITSSPLQKKKQKTSLSTPGSFANSSKQRFKLRLNDQTGCCIFEGSVTGRSDVKTGYSQYQVGSILDQLAAYRESVQRENFCIMGITLLDLYDGPKDLFCAGMAFGGSKVAVFSFHRYHPHLRMNPLHWWDYGYSKRAGSYSYFEVGQKPQALVNEAPFSLSKSAQVEYLRRNAKLLLHELGHLYGVDHCTFYRCLMMGTGHLVEDFAAPFHVCGICLRKLQWRLGFSIQKRHAEQAKVFKKVGLEKESKREQRLAKEIRNVGQLKTKA